MHRPACSVGLRRVARAEHRGGDRLAPDRRVRGVHDPASKLAGALRTIAKGGKIRIGDQAVRRAKTRDMERSEMQELRRLLSKFFSEEEQEPEHAAMDCSGKKDCGCGCKH